MRVLIIKTSSMGDVIHTLPAVTDAGKAIPSILFDWVVEENFAEIPSWNPWVRQVIPVALRRWRKNLSAKQTWTEWKAFRKALRLNQYDLVIDAQGLLKSAAISFFAKGKKAGFNWGSAREALASLFYRSKCQVAKKEHAITRVRELFSQALGDPLPDSIPGYGIDRARFYDEKFNQPYFVFLHGTRWTTKHWPENYWIELAALATAKNFGIKLLWGNEQEKARAERIAAISPKIEVLPRLSLSHIVRVLANAQVVVGVDTGLSHLTAALNVPAITLYGPSNAILTGALGEKQIHLSVQFPCAPCLKRECTFAPSSAFPPCFTTVSPSIVWNEILKLISS